MYRNRKACNNVKRTASKRPLNIIDENTTIKVPCSTTTYNNDSTNVNQEHLEHQSSEENIPESQGQTQRYLSQRSVLAATLGRTQSRSNCSRPPNTYFELVLQKAGVQLEESDDVFVLSCDHIKFVDKLRDVILHAKNYPENVESFKTGLSNAMSAKSKYAIKLLTGCTISVPGQEQVYQTQDSMYNNFLMISLLRPAALEVLLDKIEKIAKETQAPLSTNPVPLLSLMLAQLRNVTLCSEDINERIRSIFIRANDAAKADIIANAKYIFDAKKHDEFAELLIESYAQSKDLFDTSTVQTLTSLSLSSKMQFKLHARIISFIKDNQCPTSTLPELIKFLLKILNEDTDDAARQLVLTLREIFTCHIQSTSNKNGPNQQNELKLFNFIVHGLRRSKRFYYFWQKTIAGLAATQFKSFDFVILLLLMHIKEENSLYIENLIRRRIKLEHIGVEILDDIKRNSGHIMEQHINLLMQLLYDFMGEKHKTISYFGKSGFINLFKICKTTQKQIIKKIMELTCDKSKQNMGHQALQLLRELQRKYPSDMQNWGLLLMPLLDRLQEMTLAQTRTIMELLCSIAYPAPKLTECHTLQDQIDMLVKKQLINKTGFVKKQGIISSVQLIDSMARVEENCMEQEDFDVSYDTISELPDGRGKNAANFVTLIQSATAYCAESLALFYDELAKVCATTTFEHDNKELYQDKPFLIWLCELMTYYFQKSFVAEHQPTSLEGITLQYKKCINTLEDTATHSEAEVLNIAINISELVLKPSGIVHGSILILAPLFNLVRVLHLQRYGGSLQSINALLGCAIILPDFFDDATSDSFYIDDFDRKQQKYILDIYFHTVNWMRVIICAFATQREPGTRKKVLQRLADLILIEQKIKLMLAHVPIDYIPPQCKFVNDAEHVGVKGGGVSCAVGGAAGRGRPLASSTRLGHRSNAKTNHNQNETLNQMLNDTAAAKNLTRLNNSGVKLAGAGKNKTKHIDFEHIYGCREEYRELDSDIMLLLHEEFSMQYPLDEAEIGEHLGLLEFRFILTDLINKLDSVVGINTNKNDSTSSGLQYIAKPYYFICDLSKFLNIIGKNMELLSRDIKQQLDHANFVYSNADLFTERLNYIKVCFSLCIRLIASYYTWPEFADETHEQLLKESMLSLLPKKANERLRNKNKSLLASALFDHFLEYESSVVNLGCAMQMHHLLLALHKHANTDDSEHQETIEKQKQDIRKLCRTFLCRKWYNYDGTMEKGAQCNIHLDDLVKGFLRDSNFMRQKEILRILQNECQELKSKEGTLTSFPNFKKANFPILYRGLCEVLITSLNDKIVSNECGEDDRLKVWEKSCNLLNLLLDIVQNAEQPRNFFLFLKYSHIYIKLMLQHGIKVLEQHLRQNPERVLQLLKHQQQVTRYLHNLTCHSKALKNVTIVNQIPLLRETVTTFVCAVKAILAANKCHDAFWMGDLVNKDLHGDRIVEQSDTFTSYDGDGSDAEMPEDDVSIEESICTTDAAATHCETITSDNVSAITSRGKSSSRSKCI